MFYRPLDHPHFKPVSFNFGGRHCSENLKASGKIFFFFMSESDIKDKIAEIYCMHLTNKTLYLIYRND